MAKELVSDDRRWQTSHRRPGTSDRHPIRAKERHPLRDATPRDGLRKRSHLLATLTRVARGWSMGEAASSPLGSSWRGKANRLRTPSTATAGVLGCSSKIGSSLTCWPSRARLMCGPASASTESAKYSKLSVGEGSKGPRLYDWFRLPLNPPMQEGFQRWLVVRRSIEDPEELSAYTVFAPEGITLEALAKAAGSRWRVEIGFEEAKVEVGLAHYEVRSWHGWYRHITLSLFAHAFLAAIRAAGLDIRTPEKGGRKSPGNLSEFKRKRGLSWS